MFSVVTLLQCKFSNDTDSYINQNIFSLKCLWDDSVIWYDILLINIIQNDQQDSARSWGISTVIKKLFPNHNFKEPQDLARPCWSFMEIPSSSQLPNKVIGSSSLLADTQQVVRLGANIKEASWESNYINYLPDHILAAKPKRSHQICTAPFPWRSFQIRL